jgi:hypothetical protein
VAATVGTLRKPENDQQPCPCLAVESGRKKGIDTRLKNLLCHIPKYGTIIIFIPHFGINGIAGND